jgi:hypothetical protein
VQQYIPSNCPQSKMPEPDLLGQDGREEPSQESLRLKIMKVITDFKDSDPRAPAETTYDEFLVVRDAIIKALRPFGSTSSLGCEDDTAPLPAGEQLASDGMPVFHVIWDLYDAEEWLVRVEPASGSLRSTILEELRDALASFPGWGCSLPCGTGMLLLYSDRVLHRGPLFEGCFDWPSVLERVDEARPPIALDTPPIGDVPPLDEWLRSEDPDVTRLREWLLSEHGDAGEE